MPDCALTIIKKGSGPSRSLYLIVQRPIGVVFCPVNLIGEGQIRPFSYKNSIWPNYSHKHRDFSVLSFKINSSLYLRSNTNTSSNTLLSSLSLTQINFPTHQQSLKCHPFRVTQISFSFWQNPLYE